MALTINPAVSRVSYRKWAVHVCLFVAGVGSGAFATYAIVRAIYALVTAISPVAWPAVAVPLVGLAVLRDLGLGVPVPYPSRRQVPEWLRSMVPPGVVATAFGAQLGTGFLTRFTYSTHTAFVALLAPQASPMVVGFAVLAFAVSKGIVVVSSPAGRSYAEFEPRILRRHRLRGQTTLRLVNGLLAAAAAAVLITYL